MSKLRVFNFIFLAIFASGCAIFNPPAKPRPAKPAQAIKHQPPLPSGSIKGIVSNLTYEENGYCYQITATDLSNAKLPSGKYCSDKFNAQIGDLIYAGVRNGKISSLLIINQSKPQNFKKKTTQPLIKTDKKRDISKKSQINLPKTESISFD